MNPGEFVKLKGQAWRVHRASPNRVVLIREANEVAKWRKKKGLTTREAAPLLGISQAQLVRIENGTRNCPIEVLERIK